MVGITIFAVHVRKQTRRSAVTCTRWRSPDQSPRWSWHRACLVSVTSVVSKPGGGQCTIGKDTGYIPNMHRHYLFLYLLSGAKTVLQDLRKNSTRFLYKTKHYGTAYKGIHIFKMTGGYKIFLLLINHFKLCPGTAEVHLYFLLLTGTLEGE